MGDRTFRSHGAKVFVGTVGFINISPLRGCLKLRCWNYSVRVGESARYPTVCERCVEALKEIEFG